MLSLIGGIFDLLSAVVIGFILTGFASMLSFLGIGAAVLVLYATVGIVFALIVLVGAVLLWIKPDQHVAWGVIVLLFSLFGIITLGGFFIGLILGLIGGILGIVFKPAPPMMAPPMTVPPS